MDSFIEILLQWGYLGLFIGSILPLSADVLLIGLLAIGGKAIPAILVAALGNWAGATAVYYLGKLGKWEWLRRFTRIKQESMLHYRGRIEKYGALMGLAAGIPVIGDIFAAALGFFRVHYRKAGPFIFIGKLIRFVVIAALFYGISPAFA